MNKTKKAALLMVLFLALAGAVYAASNWQIMAAIFGVNIKASDSPIITNGFLDKTKYFPGEQMLITAETKDASSAKAFVENEKGYNEVNLTMTAELNGKKIWTGKWKVADAVSNKEYDLKIVVYNEFGSAEKILGWADPPPNPGHSWSQLGDFPADCSSGQYVTAIDTGTCGTPTGSGDITGVAAGTGLSGGGTSGNVTLSADTSYLQRRVSGTCAAGNSIREVKSDGTVTCEVDDGITSESDPQVGTLTNTKWCTTDGTDIDCASNAPVITESDPQVGTLTNTKWCTTDGTDIDCASNAPVTSESDTLQTVTERGASTNKNITIDTGSAGGTSLTASGFIGINAVGSAPIGGYGIYAQGGQTAIGAVSTYNGSYGVYGESSGAVGYGVYCSATGVGGKCGGNKAWTNTSDKRLKEEIKPIENALNKTLQLQGVTFKWKNGTANKSEMGLIAQDALPIVPEVVDMDTDGYYTMKQSELVALLVEAIKEQQKQIESLSETVEQQQAAIDKLSEYR